MTIQVPAAELAATLVGFDHAYLITQRGADQPVKILTVDPVLADGRLLVATESESVRAGVAADDRVTLVWPPRVRHGHTLIVDGHATLIATGLETGLEVRFEHGMLHRPRTHADGPDWQLPIG